MKLPSAGDPYEIFVLARDAPSVMAASCESVLSMLALTDIDMQYEEGYLRIEAHGNTPDPNALADQIARKLWSSVDHYVKIYVEMKPPQQRTFRQFHKEDYDEFDS